MENIFCLVFGNLPKRFVEKELLLLLTCRWGYSFKFSTYSQYLSSSWQLLYAFSDSLLDLVIFFVTFWQGKLHPITKHEQIHISIPMLNDIMPHCFNSLLFFFLLVFLYFMKFFRRLQLSLKISANYLSIKMGWREEFDFEVPCFSPFFTASLNKNSVYYLPNDF